MLMFTPVHPVSYRGLLHGAGVAFEIDEADADRMANYGTVRQEEDKPAKRGRPKKVSE